MQPVRVRLNVGGRRFETTRATLVARHPDSLLARMCAPDNASLAKRDDDGALFVDRDGDAFAPVLDYLRTGALDEPADARAEARLRRELDFWGIDPRPLLGDDAEAARHEAERNVGALLAAEISAPADGDGDSYDADAVQRLGEAYEARRVARLAQTFLELQTPRLRVHARLRHGTHVYVLMHRATPDKAFRSWTDTHYGEQANRASVASILAGTETFARWFAAGRLAVLGGGDGSVDASAPPPGATEPPSPSRGPGGPPLGEGPRDVPPPPPLGVDYTTPSAPPSSFSPPPSPLAERVWRFDEAQRAAAGERIVCLERNQLGGRRRLNFFDNASQASRLVRLNAHVAEEIRSLFECEDEMRALYTYRVSLAKFGGGVSTPRRAYGSTTLAWLDAVRALHFNEACAFKSSLRAAMPKPLTVFETPTARAEWSRLLAARGLATHWTRGELSWRECKLAGATGGICPSVCIDGRAHTCTPAEGDAQLTPTDTSGPLHEAGTVHDCARRLHAHEMDLVDVYSTLHLVPRQTRCDAVYWMCRVAWGDDDGAAPASVPSASARAADVGAPSRAKRRRTALAGTRGTPAGGGHAGLPAAADGRVDDYAYA